MIETKDTEGAALPCKIVDSSPWILIRYNLLVKTKTLKVYQDKAVRNAEKFIMLATILRSSSSVY